MIRALLEHAAQAVLTKTALGPSTAVRVRQYVMMKFVV
jgi:hypothetical protein